MLYDSPEPGLVILRSGRNRRTRSGAFPYSVTLHDWPRKPKVKKSFFGTDSHRCSLKAVAPFQIFRPFMVFVSTLWRNFIQDITIWCLSNYLPIVTLFCFEFTDRETVMLRDFFYLAIKCFKHETLFDEKRVPSPT